MAYRNTIVSTPSYTYIPGGLNVGSQIIIRGRVPAGEERFSINLQNSDEDGSDIAFHFNPRNDQETVVRNSYQGGWQEEERDHPFFPFSYGSKFTVRIFVSPDAYVVMVNGDYFLEYQHRLNYQDVRFLRLSDGAEFYEVTVQNQCRVPYYGEFPGGLTPGKALRVRGVVKDSPDRFSIYFKCDQEGQNVGVVFNPRQDQQDVVLNTKIDGNWGEEERGLSCEPFQASEFFDVLFVTYNDSFNIYVNDLFYTSYNFRVPGEAVKFLEIVGDVCLMDVQFADPLDDCFVKQVPSGLEKDDLISVKGFFYPEGNRFTVNLLYGTSPDDDIALHFNPRRDDGELVLNSRERGDWMEEERHGLPSGMLEPVPYPFNVEIVNKEEKFKIYVNGRKTASFKSRGNVEEIRGINVCGEAYIYEVKLLRSLDKPWVEKVPGILEPHSWISLTGTPVKGSNRFAVNLQTGDSGYYDSDVALHFNPRFDEESVVCNDLTDGNWGDERRDGPEFPFVPKDRFDINILVRNDIYRVFVNQKRYIDFPHRTAPENVSHIMLTGECDFFDPEFF